MKSLPVASIGRQPLTSSRRSRGHRPLSSATAVPAFATVIALVVCAGWRMRSESPFTAESGVGYALGVVGGTMMLLMLSYSARKRLRWMRGWGRIKVWFQAHMLLGVLGPVAILFHANFGLGSTNSNVALFSMLIVVASGIVGRFLYTRLTHELYGHRATLRELRDELTKSKERLERTLPMAPATRARLIAFEAAARAPATDWRSRILWLASLPLEARRLRTAFLRELSAPGDGSTTDDLPLRAASEAVDAYVSTLLKESQFSIYERLFSLWHALHLPLFVLLVCAGTIHVIAVHMY